MTLFAIVFYYIIYYRIRHLVFNIFVVTLENDILLIRLFCLD